MPVVIVLLRGNSGPPRPLAFCGRETVSRSNSGSLIRDGSAESSSRKSFSNVFDSNQFNKFESIQDVPSAVTIIVNRAVGMTCSQALGPVPILEDCAALDRVADAPENRGLKRSIPYTTKSHPT